MTGPLFRFPKSDRLYLRKEIEELFKTGQPIREFPLKAVFDFIPLQNVPVKTTVMVPKKIFKRAVDRNRIKRQMREAFRQNNSQIKEYFLNHATTARVMFIFTGKELPDYALIQTKIILILQRLQKQYELGIV